MTREELLALGLTEDQAGAVLEGFLALSSQLDAQLAQAKQTEVEKADLAAQLAAAQAEIALRLKRDQVLSALPPFKPRDVQLLLRLIDMSLIEIADGKINGLHEQIAALRETAPYLFLDAPDPVGGCPAGGLGPTEFDMNAFLRGER